MPSYRDRALRGMHEYIDEVEAERDALTAEVKRLREALHYIAEPDVLLDANEGAFTEHAARRMQEQARYALAANPAAAGSVTPTGDDQRSAAISASAYRRVGRHDEAAEIEAAAARRVGQAPPPAEMTSNRSGPGAAKNCPGP